MYSPPAFASDAKPSHAGAPGIYGYGSAPQTAETTFEKRPRRRLNIIPIFVCLFVPWVVFSALYAVLAFQFHYYHANLTTFAIAASVICVLASVAYGMKVKLGKYFLSDNASTEPNWTIALALLMVIAWVAAFYLGQRVYTRYTHPYYDVVNFNSYSNVRPDAVRGEQLMDAGIVTFTSNTTIDFKKSMGFKNGAIYCVAPIVQSTAPSQVYDLWAVGINCCDSTSPTFNCRSSSRGTGRGAVRLMNDGARPFYRLAVQEAEAQYSIKANHPVFFNWEPDPVSVVETWRRMVLQSYVIGVFGHFVFQIFSVTCLTLLFSRFSSSQF